jgi:hypothetical protein
MEAAPMINAPQTCAECERLSAEYESATIRWFRLDSQRQIAAFGRDTEASFRIAGEISIVDDQRTALRDALVAHNSQEHDQSATRARAAA